MQGLSKELARKIIETVGSSGIPPEHGFQYFTYGLEEYLNAIEQRYLAEYIKDGGSCFKLVVGNYGGGKTHFLYCVRDLAWRHNFVTSYCSLSQTETPFSDLEKIYRAIIANLAYPITETEQIGYEKGIEAIVKSWFVQQYQSLKTSGLSDEDIKRELKNYIASMRNFEDISFTNAVKNQFLCLLEQKEEDFNEILVWLKAEGYDPAIHLKYKIFHRVDSSFSFSLIRSLIQFVREIGYTGLVVLFDEAEQITSITARQSDKMLNNLRQLVDECATSSIAGSMFFYAVPDMRFVEGKRRVYEALKQRLQTIFEGRFNPEGVKILLENLPVKPSVFLTEVGWKLAEIYQKAYDKNFNPKSLEQSIKNMADAAYGERHLEVSYRRLFVQALILALNILKEQPEKIISLEMAEALIKKIA
jgi:hypothetical protein